MPGLRERVAAIQAVLSPCAEKESLLERELKKELDERQGGSGWIDADILEAVANTDDGGGQQLLGNREQVRACAPPPASCVHACIQSLRAKASQRNAIHSSTPTHTHAHTPLRPTQ